MDANFNTNIFEGKLVRLVAEDAKTMAEAFSRWGRDAEFSRLQSSNTLKLFSAKPIQEWLEEKREKESDQSFHFMIRTLKGNMLIGDIELEVFWNHQDAFVGIGLGERSFWGKGYGTDAMRVLLRFAFGELNLQHVSLNVFKYNPRAIRSYEKVGFAHEGHQRQMIDRDGRRWDLLFMGILHEEWLAQQPSLQSGSKVSQEGRMKRRGI
jgi:RimJ/RimL family protein N-acetyltransferase